jgi:hypothetical protein
VLENSFMSQLGLVLGFAPPSGQVRPGIREYGESEAGTKRRRLLREPDEETGEDTETDTDAETETRTILGTARDVADDEDNGQDTE